jgi:hypothetical protein
MEENKLKMAPKGTFISSVPLYLLLGMPMMATNYFFVSLILLFKTLPS